MSSIVDYKIYADNKIFETENFQNTAVLKKYLSNITSNESSSDSSSNLVFDCIYAMVENMMRLRFCAEEEYKNKSFTARDKRKVLPLNWEKITDVMTKEEDEPPETVITRIAQQQFHILKYVCGNTRKILERKRQKVHISAVQQLDAQCLIWLTRQPGITPAQKGGSRQKILSVIREESYNTLENRVLKSLLKNCAMHCILYHRQYSKKYPKSKRIQAVEKLLSFSKKELVSSLMQNVAELIGMPMPNYVLLHDTHYSKIWQMYLDLLRQTKLTENTWKYRHLFFQEYFLFYAVVNISLTYKFIFESNVWLKYFPKEGCFVQSGFPPQLFKKDKTNDLVEFCPRNAAFHQFPEMNKEKSQPYNAYLKNKNNTSFFLLFYIPSNIQETFEIPKTKNHIIIIFNESTSIIKTLNHENVFVLNSFKDIENVIPQIIEKTLGRMSHEY